MMTGVRNALTRKIGPLAAWAWLALLAGGVYLWRRRSGTASATTAATDTTGTAGTPDTRDPVTLQPGEGVYDPQTGQLVGQAPEQQPAPTPGDPVVLEPGQTVYDPASGKIVGGQTVDGSNTVSVTPTKKPSALDRAKAAVAKGKVGPINRQRLQKAGYTKSQINYHLARGTALGKPKPKPKPQHKPPAPVKHPTTQKPRSRGAATIKKAGPTRYAPTKPAPKAKPRPKPIATTNPVRPKPTVKKKPVTKQHPQTTTQKKKK